eukprot:scaffold549_cov174-Ochromonas_danica.AAC.15
MPLIIVIDYELKIDITQCCEDDSKQLCDKPDNGDDVIVTAEDRSYSSEEGHLIIDAVAMKVSIETLRTCICIGCITLSTVDNNALYNCEQQQSPSV